VYQLVKSFQVTFCLTALLKFENVCDWESKTPHCS